MAVFGRISVLISCLFLAFLSACSASQFQFCTNNSLVDTRTKPEGNIVFPLTTLNYTAKRCNVMIRSPFDDKTELTLVNLRRKQPNEQCANENSIEIVTELLNGESWYEFCKSVGSKETIILKSTIKMIYRAPFRNEIRVNSTENTISVHYKRLQSTACRHVLKAKRGVFQNSGYPNYPQQGDCEWVIDTGKGEGISLEFKILYANRLNCDNNFIEVRQGDSIEAPELVKICSPSQQIERKSSSTKLWIHVKSSTTNGIGFQATYNTETCEVVTANKQLDFQSQKTSCQTWNLTAPSGHIAALSFSNINLVSADSVSCMGNVLEVWDGETTMSYCNLKLPPPIIMSKGRKLVVTYRTMDSKYNMASSFQASFTSIFPSSYKTNCFVRERELSFECNNQQVIPCAWQCDGAMQCSDNSDENPCSDMQERWHKLQVFVIVIGSICASTVMFCIGLICFRKCLIHNEPTTRRGRHLSVTDQSPLTPDADLPSPPPCYFTDRDNEPPASVIRGTYFFGDEFSQSGIHSASLFGIPPPRYRSTESLHQSNAEARSIWQRGMSSIPLVPTDTSRGTEIIPLPEENPPDYESISADKDEQILIAAQNNQMTAENASCVQENPESSSNECFVNDNDLNTEMDIELQTHVTNASDIDIGITNAGAMLKV